MIVADLRRPAAIFDDDAIREFIDLSEPFAVLTASILQHLADDEDPQGVAGSVACKP